MTQEQALWLQEQHFWDQTTQPLIEDRQVTHDEDTAILSYRVTGAQRELLCQSTYTRACGAWMLIEHRQTAA